MPTNTTHTPPPTPQTKVQAWFSALGAGLLFWVVAGTFLIALVW